MRDSGQVKIIGQRIADTALVQLRINEVGDATKITAVIAENFNAVELLGLRELMLNRDMKRIDEYEKTWRAQHGEPVIPDFVHGSRPESGNKYAFHLTPTVQVAAPSGDAD